MARLSPSAVCSSKLAGKGVNCLNPLIPIPISAILDAVADDNQILFRGNIDQLSMIPFGREVACAPVTLETVPL